MINSLKIIAMKKIIVIIASILLFVSMQALADGTNISYVKSGDHVFFGKDLRIGLFNTRIIVGDGSSILIPNKKVDAYLHDSRLFERLPVVCANNKTADNEMMEFVKSRAGLKLYRYKLQATEGICYAWYVFKDGKHYLSVNKQNCSTVLPFFGLEVIDN